MVNKVPSSSVAIDALVAWGGVAMDVSAGVINSDFISVSLAEGVINVSDGVAVDLFTEGIIFNEVCMKVMLAAAIALEVEVAVPASYAIELCADVVIGVLTGTVVRVATEIGVAVIVGVSVGMNARM